MEGRSWARSRMSCCSFLVLIQLLTTKTIIKIGAEPVAPNMSSCHLPDLPVGEKPFDCCAPMASYSPRLYRPAPSSWAAVRVRRPAHRVDDAYATKLARAYALMKALPDDDPRSFKQQANIHCAYCNTVYNQINSSELFQVHGSWLFFPFHRWYLYFHERILAKLLGEDEFALSFWNYDLAEGASIPWLFDGFNETLAHGERDPNHKPPATVAIDFTWDTDQRSREKQLQENDNALYRAIVRDGSTPEAFMGEPYRQGYKAHFNYGSLEKRPHNSVHIWVGNRSDIGWKDMGSFYAAARDPVFYAHHAQLDRLWHIWRSISPHSEYQDPDFLDSEFLFYTEDAELVRVKVGDSLNMSNLGYTYQNVDTPWINSTPIRLSLGLATLTPNDTLCVIGNPILTPCSLSANRQPQIVKSSPWLRDYLVFNFEYSPLEPAHLDIYINLPSANAQTNSGCMEFIDFNIIEPPFENSIENITTITSRYDISERLVDLELTEENIVIITIVPRGLDTIASPFSILDFYIEYAPLPSLNKRASLYTPL